MNPHVAIAHLDFYQLLPGQSCFSYNSLFPSCVIFKKIPGIISGKAFFFLSSMFPCLTVLTPRTTKSLVSHVLPEIHVYIK